MVEDPGEQFDLLGPGPFDGGVVEDEHGLPVLAGQDVEHGHGLERQVEKKPSPAVAAGGKEVVDGVLAHVGTGIRDNGPEDVLAEKRQRNQGEEQVRRRYALCFCDSTASGKAGYVESSEKHGNPACGLCMIILQNLESCSIFHVDTSFFCSCCIATTVYRERKCPSS